VAALIIGGGLGYALRGWLQPVSDSAGDVPSASASTPAVETSGPAETAAPAGAARPTVIPPNAVADLSGIKANAAPASAPLLVVYQDYQCPWCAYFDSVFSPTVRQAIAQNNVRVEYHTMNFLDQRNDPASATAESSTRAAMGAVCADFAGVYDAYHDLVYANQPDTEGDGFTDELLRDQLPAQAGLSGNALTSFQQCYDSGSARDFVVYTNAMAQQAGVKGTPTYMLDGVQLNLDPNDPSSLQAALDAVI
jgi:protein-disulfide isomerase